MLLTRGAPALVGAVLVESVGRVGGYRAHEEPIAHEESIVHEEPSAHEESSVHAPELFRVAVPALRFYAGRKRTPFAYTSNKLGCFAMRKVRGVPFCKISSSCKFPIRRGELGSCSATFFRTRSMLLLA